MSLDHLDCLPAQSCFYAEQSSRVLSFSRCYFLASSSGSGACVAFDRFPLFISFFFFWEQRKEANPLGSPTRSGVLQPLTPSKEKRGLSFPPVLFRFFFKNILTKEEDKIINDITKVILFGSELLFVLNFLGTYILMCT